MATKDEFKAARKAYFKNATPKQKWQYFCEYYLVHTIIIALILIAVSNFIYHIVADPDIILSGLFLNVKDLENEAIPTDLGHEFLELQEIDTSKYDVRFNEGLYLTGDDTLDLETGQAIWVQIRAATVDFIISPVEHIMDFAYNESFVDLRTILSEEQIAKYEPYFLYIDGAVVKEVAESSKDLDNQTPIALPDCTKPEEMEDPIPVFIDMTQYEKLTELYGDKVEIPAFCILVNAPNPELTIDFLEYLTE